MPVAKTSLEQDFLKHYNITTVHKQIDGGQKKVFIITKTQEKCVLKLFQNFGERETRELDIYEKYKNNIGIPKVILIDNYHGDVIVFEEYIDGNDLSDIKDSYKSDYGKIKKLIIEICDILEPIWKDAITHRDLKPNNIIIKPNGRPVVIDFGIARDSGLGSLTLTGFMPKTPLYAAPEQVKGIKDQISYRTDFFSLSIIAYYLYYSKLPFGSTAAQVEKKYDENDLSYHTNDDCKLNELFSSVFKINPSERPRNVDLFRGLLK